MAGRDHLGCMQLTARLMQAWDWSTSTPISLLRYSWTALPGIGETQSDSWPLFVIWREVRGSSCALAVAFPLSPEPLSSHCLSDWKATQHQSMCRGLYSCYTPLYTLTNIDIQYRLSYIHKRPCTHMQASRNYFISPTLRIKGAGVACWGLGQLGAGLPKTHTCPVWELNVFPWC